MTDPIRDALAHPEPEVPTDDRIMDVAREADLVYYMGQGLGFASPYMEGADITEEVLAFARAVLARWGNHPESPDSSPQPIPVSERLPGPEDCDAKGRCWWYGEGGDMVGWTLDAEGLSCYRAKYWLPARAVLARWGNL
jgi:hypothetical protein